MIPRTFAKGQDGRWNVSDVRAQTLVQEEEARLPADDADRNDIWDGKTISRPSAIHYALSFLVSSGAKVHHYSRVVPFPYVPHLVGIVFAKQETRGVVCLNLSLL